MWEVVYHPAAEEERKQLPTNERIAVQNVIEKLRVLGPQLPAPHQSNVQGAEGLRELRPRQGRSPWRAFYRRIGDALVIGAIGPEAQKDNRRFKRAVKKAQERLDEVQAN